MNRMQWLHQLHDWGINLVPQKYPINPSTGKDDKVPVIPWKNGDKDYTQERQSWEEVVAMPWDQAKGAAAVLGAVSNHWIAFDLDKQETERALIELGEELDLAFYMWVVKTPGGGYQLWLRCEGLAEYLASVGIPSKSIKEGKLDWTGRYGGHIELRFEGLLNTLPYSRRRAGTYKPLNGEITAPPAQVSPARVWKAFQKIAEQPAAPAPAPRPTYTPSELPSDASELEEVERRTRLEIEKRLGKHKHKPGYYVCPEEHDGGNKDFLYSAEVGAPISACQGKHKGHLTRWMDLAEHLEIDTTKIAREVWEEHHLLGHHSIYPNKPEASENGDCSNSDFHKPRRFAGGWPVTLNDRLVGAHLRFKQHRIKSQHPAAQVMLAWHEMREIMPDAAVFTAGEFQRATEAIGRDYSRRTTDTGLEQVVAWGFFSCTFCNTDSSMTITERLSIGGSKCTTSAAPGEKLYQALPIDEALRNFEQHWRFLLEEIAFEEIPANVRPEYGELTPEDVALLDEIRTPIYEQYAGLRRLAQKRLITRNDPEAAHQLDKYLDGDLERIRAGRYQSVAVQAGPLPNTKAFRQALIMQPYHENPTYVRENANRVASRKAGVTRATASRYRDQLGLVLEDRTKEMPSEQVSDALRRSGRVLAEDPTKGTAIIRLPSAERLLATAPEETRQAYEQRQQAKATRQDRRRQQEDYWDRRLAEWQEESVNAPDSAPEQDEPEYSLVIPISSVEPRAEIIPTAYSDGYLLRQLDYTPGASELERYHIDKETGEIIDYTPSELWRMMADRIRMQRNTELMSDPVIAFALDLGGQIGIQLTHAESVGS